LPSPPVRFSLFFLFSKRKFKQNFFCFFYIYFIVWLYVFPFRYCVFQFFRAIIQGLFNHPPFFFKILFVVTFLQSYLNFVGQFLDSFHFSFRCHIHPSGNFFHRVLKGSGRLEIITSFLPENIVSDFCPRANRLVGRPPAGPVPARICAVSRCRGAARKRSLFSLEEGELIG